MIHFFEQNKQVLVKYQNDSFNQFIEEIISNILQNNNIIPEEKPTDNKIIRYRLTFDDLDIKPSSFDNDRIENIHRLDQEMNNL
jgi:hypothetical protein